MTLTRNSVTSFYDGDVDDISDISPQESQSNDITKTTLGFRSTSQH